MGGGRVVKGRQGRQSQCQCRDSDGEGESAEERILFLSDVNVKGGRLKHGEHEAEMMQPRFLTQLHSR